LIPDFLIGAHACEQADCLAARDRGYLRRYFPQLRILTPPARNLPDPFPARSWQLTDEAGGMASNRSRRVLTPATRKMRIKCESC
jgi:hypothetical protein